MRLDLNVDEVNLLKEVIKGIKEVANETEDDKQLSYILQVEKRLGKISYSEFKNHQVEFLWYVADTGSELAKQLASDAEQQETKDKAITVQNAYEKIKTDIQETIIRNSPKKV